MLGWECINSASVCVCVCVCWGMMLRVCVELLLLLGLLVLSLHGTVLRDNTGQTEESLHENIGFTSQLNPEEPKAFRINPQNFPQLSNADISRHNPNIQITIEVLDGSEGAEQDKDLQQVKSPSRTNPNWRDWWSRSTSTSQHPTGHRHSVYNDYIDRDGDWGAWSACSVTCGHGNQKRTKSCGYACTATESRTCDLPKCPGIEEAFRTAATEVGLLAGTREFNATELFGVDTDSCERWMNCKSEFLRKYLLKVLSDLPACPCSYPTEVAYSSTELLDTATQKPFRWKDASGPKERLEIYKPTARYCIRSALALHSSTLAAQHCCYDNAMKLITRGKGAGSPNLISSDFSYDLHYKVDVLPWVVCKGDWSRYNRVRPPNNGRGCPGNPTEEDYRKQCEEAREF